MPIYIVDPRQPLEGCLTLVCNGDEAVNALKQIARLDLLSEDAESWNECLGLVRSDWEIDKEARDNARPPLSSRS